MRITISAYKNYHKCLWEIRWWIESTMWSFFFHSGMDLAESILEKRVGIRVCAALCEPFWPTYGNVWEDAAFQNWSNSVHFTPFRMSPSVWQRIRKDHSTEGFQTLSVISLRERCCRLGFPSEREFSENDEEKIEGEWGVEPHKGKIKEEFEN